MPIYKPSELARYLDDLGISPKKGLSQNFLLDGNIIHKITQFSSLTPNDIVLEIGPGPGAMTEAMLKTGAKVVAVEKDRILAKGLERLKPSGDLEVFCDDILEFPIDSLRNYGKALKVVANLPYHVTTPIIQYLIPRNDLFAEVVVMVQEEVARRFVARPGTKDYGSLTVFLNVYSAPEYGFKVSHNCFYPKPKVDSAVVKFKLHPPPQGICEESFFQMTRHAFGKRRKMLTSTLRDLYPLERVQTVLSEIKGSHKCRPEELSLEEFLKLYKGLNAL